MRWFDRSFDFTQPEWMLPPVLERLRGTPARLEERLRPVDPRQCVVRPSPTAWSLQEHAGHLLDLEALWLGRVDDFLAREARLRAADLSNRGTEEGRFNERELTKILSEFRTRRTALVARLETAAAAVTWTALHPRLAQPMRLIDHAFFVAEHDDHHLAAIGALIAGR